MRSNPHADKEVVRSVPHLSVLIATVAGIGALAVGCAGDGDLEKAQEYLGIDVPSGATDVNATYLSEIDRSAAVSFTDECSRAADRAEGMRFGSVLHEGAVPSLVAGYVDALDADIDLTQAEYGQDEISPEGRLRIFVVGPRNGKDLETSLSCTYLVVGQSAT
jgi:hypothetical protein